MRLGRKRAHSFKCDSRRVCLLFAAIFVSAVGAYIDFKLRNVRNLADVMNDIYRIGINENQRTTMVQLDRGRIVEINRMNLDFVVKGLRNENVLFDQDAIDDICEICSYAECDIEIIDLVKICSYNTQDHWRKMTNIQDREYLDKIGWPTFITAPKTEIRAS